MYKQVQRLLQHIQTTPSLAPYNIKEEQNNNERTPSSKPTMEQWHNEDNTSKYQNECQTYRKSTHNSQNKQPILIKYI